MLPGCIFVNILSLYREGCMCFSCLTITRQVGLLCFGKPSGSVWWWPGCMVKICSHAHTATVVFPKYDVFLDQHILLVLQQHS